MRLASYLHPDASFVLHRRVVRLGKRLRERERSQALEWRELDAGLNDQVVPGTGIGDQRPLAVRHQRTDRHAELGQFQHEFADSLGLALAGLTEQEQV